MRLKFWILLGVLATLVSGLRAQAQTGLPLVPDAWLAPEGTASLQQSYSPEVAELKASLAPFDWAQASFSYDFYDLPSLIADNDGSWVDRSLDAELRLWPEGDWRPQVSIGLQDLLGTGDRSAEYLAASKSFEGFNLTAGLGWGALAGEQGWSNPIYSYLGERGEGSVLSGWSSLPFTGPQISPFAGISWQPQGSDWSFAVDYSQGQAFRSVYNQAASPISAKIGKQTRFGQVSLAYLQGSTWQISLERSANLHSDSFRKTPRAEPQVPLEHKHRLRPGLEASDENFAAMSALLGALQSQGLEPLALGFVSDRQIALRAENNGIIHAREAITLANQLLVYFTDPEVTQISVALMQGERSLLEVRTNRDEILAQRPSYWLAHQAPPAITEPLFQLEQPARILDLSLSPRAQPVYGYSNQFASRQTYLGLSLDAEQANGWGLEVEAGYTLKTTFDTLEARSNSELERVRSRQAEYLAGRGGGFVDRLMLTHNWQLGQQTWAKAAAGYLEPGFAGLATEVFHAPNGANWGIGLEAALVRQRAPGNADLEPDFGLEDYQTWTLQASWHKHWQSAEEWGLGALDTRLTAGRYLAGDWGGTLEIGKTFDSGIRVAGFATFTDAGISAFGEGGFDKGVSASIPLDLISKQASAKRRTLTYRPILGDGGARLNWGASLADDWRFSGGWGL